MHSNDWQDSTDTLLGLARWLVEGGASGSDIVDLFEKPWKFEPEYHEWREAEREALDPDSTTDRRLVVLQRVTLDGQPATIAGIHNSYATVLAVDGSVGPYTWSWSDVFDIAIKGNGEFLTKKAVVG